MSQPLISIIICTYNRKQFLPETLESIFNQQYSPVEIIVIDDGSTDDTEELIKTYSENIKYYRQHNQGITAARNYGCRMARGELITFQDDDDPMPANKLVDLQQALQDHPDAVFAVGDLAVIDNHSQQTGERWLPEKNPYYSELVVIKEAYTAVLWPTVPATPNTTLFRRSIAEQIDWFDSSFTVGSEDKDFYARLAYHAPIVYLPRIITYYRRGHASMTGKASLIAASQIALFTKHMQMNNNVLLAKRLQIRLYNAMKTFTEHLSTDIETKLPGDINYYTLGLSSLTQQLKLYFYLFRYVKLPLKKLIKNSGS